ncbi:hypothetical protein B1222_00855 [Paenibacillus larvae subsp. pulvifaciens]|uniref:Uncharacterized protein n=1 Tax=Paenibacillus larvae subsp. pulvifaciens TaxID=1477 RepID=A0A1V0UYA2_9BACL|nr:hypothetical protein BXP28_05740 [Paenibacillus larvae subsp. larvae]AQT83327.1 hypothetical protein B1222_00855 [Paenibacillus larvae subsp. pulvifaciens]AQZ48463.1 hypothetical protein B5S25_19610 [Paenibacillus larvae subsp. pulvifaciens]ARF70143.1 hypothetical protein B7C51_23325 [Paenibacillus larvae subsp. pulvifaciens]MBH0341433.1 hypothetical protein [Paenibacillus larvae]
MTLAAQSGFCMADYAQPFFSDRGPRIAVILFGIIQSRIPSGISSVHRSKHEKTFPQSRKARGIS